MRTWLSCLLAILACSLPAVAAGEEGLIPLLREQDEGIDLRVLQTEDGYLFDVAVTEESEDEITLRIFSGDTDVTASAQSGSPPIAIAYVFTDGDESLQCRAKWRMDSILGQDPTASLAFSKSPNSLCPELGFAGTTADWPQLFQDDAGYRRLLVILVGTAADGSVFDPSGPLIWDQLALADALQEDTAALARRLTDFVLPNLAGTLMFLPYPDGDRNAAISAAIFKNGTAVFEVSNTEPPEPPDMGSQQTATIVAVVAGALLLGFLVILATRKTGRFVFDAPRGDTPLRAVTIGYGAGFDYSLGSDGEAAVARIELYRDGRRKLVRLEPKTRIEVDGSNVKDQSWIDNDSAIRIAQRKIVVS